MTANNNTHERSKNVASHQNNTAKLVSDGGVPEQRRYHCPFCDVSYDNETLTRVHITRSDDDVHVNYDGLMPEVEIRVTDLDGNEITTSTKRPEEINFQAITEEMLPDDMTDQNKLIVLTASWNPYENEYAALEDEINELIKQNDLEPPSSATIRGVIQRFYRQSTNDHPSTDVSADDDQD